MNEAARQAVRFCEVIAERHPATGQYALLSGSWHYEKLWATPTSMNITVILDGLGHHPAAERYLEIFRQTQGTIVPPGKAYHKHAGYLATPRMFTSIDWLTDHGAILYAAAHHALVRDDPQFIARWTEPIMRACEFIRDFRTSSGYSWNVFHAWQAGDRPKFLEGLYSLLTGSLSRRTAIGCEHRGGVSGTLFSVPLPIELTRLSVIDDQLEPGRLHLLRLVPLAWLRTDRPTTVRAHPDGITDRAHSGSRRGWKSRSTAVAWSRESSGCCSAPQP